MNEIDFTELQEIVQECTELDIRDIKYIDSSDASKQSINIAGKINKDKEFAWKIDENGDFVGIPAVDPNCKKGDPGCIKGEADNGGG